MGAFAVPDVRNDGSQQEVVAQVHIHPKFEGVSIDNLNQFSIYDIDQFDKPSNNIAYEAFYLVGPEGSLFILTRNGLGGVSPQRSVINSSGTNIISDWEY